MKKRTAGVLPVVFALMLGTFSNLTVKAETTFVDVPNNHRAAKEVNFLAEGGILNTSSNRLNPDETITRAEAVAIIGKATQLDGTQRQTKFSDVQASVKEAGYIQSAYEKHYLSGYADGTFKPEQKVSRGEMALLISRAFNYGATNTGSANQALLSKKISTGLGNGQFGGNELIKRADYAVFIARAINSSFRPGYSKSFPQQGKVTASALTVRTGPSTQYGKITSVGNGTMLKIDHFVGTWAEVVDDKNSFAGFVSSSYLAVTSTNGGGATDPNQPDPNPTKPTTPSPVLNPLANKKIIIDPGHGGKDTGAIGNGMNEKDIVLDVGLKVQQVLNRMSVPSYLTRSTNVFIELKDRPIIAKQQKGDIFVSIHINSSAKPESGTGIETHYYAGATNPYNAQSKLLAQCIQKRLVEEWKLADRGIHPTNLYVNKYNSMPAVLAELGFINNSTDAAKLKSDYWRQKDAEAIVLGILDYYKANKIDVSSLYPLVRQ